MKIRKIRGNHEFTWNITHEFSEVSALIPVCLFKIVNSGGKNKEKVEIIAKQDKTEQKAEMKQ